MIKNYTSGVPIDRTISRIEQVLIKTGAMSISKEYSATGELDALTFRVPIPEKPNGIQVRLPANAEAVYQTMKHMVKRPQNGTLDRLKEQATRTAWKLMQDWVEVQLSLIQMRQVEVLQVFLPYVWDEQRKITLFDQLRNGGFKLLPERISE